jgi:predicted kinase
MNNLFICISVSKSGKSTFCKEVSSKLSNIKIVSLDEIKIQNKEQSSHLIAFNLINNYLKEYNVLFDANNCRYEHRLNLLNSLNIDCNKYAILFDNVSIENSCNNLKQFKSEYRYTFTTEELIKRQFIEFENDKDKLSEFIVLTKTEFKNKFYDKNIRL